MQKTTRSLYHGHRFPAVVISQAVRWYFRFQLSLRDIEELLFERGIVVSYETIRRWCALGASFAHRAKGARRKPGSTWHLDEMFVTLRGEPYLLWRAVDQHGAELDVLLQKRRDKVGRSETLLQARARRLPAGTTQDRHRPIAQLPGREGRDRAACQCPARLREGQCSREQPRRKQPSAHP